MLGEYREISASDKLIRKLRKKLRQIERLEFLGRPLNEEEIAKVASLKTAFFPPVILLCLFRWNKKKISELSYTSS